MAEEKNLDLLQKVRKGVALWNKYGIDNECTPEELRVGLNNAFATIGAMARLMMDNGYFTEEEFLEASNRYLTADVEDYEKMIAQHTGQRIKL